MSGEARALCATTLLDSIFFQILATVITFIIRRNFLDNNMLYSVIIILLL